MQIIATKYGPYLASGETVEVLLAGIPTYRGRILVVRPGHQRPYVVRLDRCLGPHTPGRRCGEVIACEAYKIRPPATEAPCTIS